LEDVSGMTLKTATIYLAQSLYAILTTQRQSIAFQAGPVICNVFHHEQSTTGEIKDRETIFFWPRKYLQRNVSVP
jgi:hypothetical protein